MSGSCFHERRVHYATLLAALGEALQDGDEAGFHACARQLGERCESDTMQDLRQITDGLQAALQRFRRDSRLDDLATREVPDARARLEHVLRLTDDAANTTLDLVEQSCPIADRAATRTDELLEAWNGVPRPSRNDVRSYLEETRSGLGQVREKLSQVLLAQGFQDLSGQIIRSVMKLVDELEVALTHMVRISGGSLEPSSMLRADVAEPALSARGFGPVVPGVAHGLTVSGQTDVDALLSDLGM
ncbi:MAG: protein phosphatase CheZ [Sinobacteraceae bacterium]|nr:protein phosphatase CheZ [Nevskiaceae bacterium]MCP5360728.1 protein phosphatase CheZ [Nevskiaceae bacterium]